MKSVKISVLSLYMAPPRLRLQLYSVLSVGCRFKQRTNGIVRIVPFSTIELSCLVLQLFLDYMFLLVLVA